MNYNFAMKFGGILGTLILIFSLLFTSCVTEPQADDSENSTIIKPQSHSSKDAEYRRSIDTLETEEEISYDTFAADKQAILEAVDQLAEIMQKKNFKLWVNYITPESKAYWSNPANLKSVSSRMPIKMLQIRSLEDYFKYIFCPSREDKHIDEIRYISTNMVQAVQVTEDKDIIYYTFLKRNDKWLVELDKIK